MLTLQLPLVTPLGCSQPISFAHNQFRLLKYVLLTNQVQKPNQSAPTSRSASAGKVEPLPFQAASVVSMARESPTLKPIFRQGIA